MTTAPTPEEAERLAMVLRSACALSHPRFGTDARFVEMLASQAQAIEKELLRLQAENERLQGSLDAQRLISARAIALAKELEARKPLSWAPQFDAMAPGQEELAIQFCAEIAGPRGQPGRNPDPVRLLEMAEALYKAEADARQVDKSPDLQEPLVDKTAKLQDRPAALIASREVVSDGPLRVTRLHLTEEGRAALTSKAAGPLPGITGRWPSPTNATSMRPGNCSP